MRLTHCCDSVAPLQNVGSKIILYPLYGVGVRSHFFWENRSQESLFRKKWSDSEHCSSLQFEFSDFSPSLRGRISF